MSSASQPPPTPSVGVIPNPIVAAVKSTLVFRCATSCSWPA